VNPERTYSDSLRELLDHILTAQEFTAGIAFDDFCAN